MDANDKDALPGLTDNELETLKKVFSSPLDIPAEWKAWLISYLEANPPDLPFTQLFGYQSFISTQVSAYAAPDPSGTVSTSSSSWTSLAGGPTLSGLKSGLYIVAWGARARNDTANGSEVICGPSVNGASPSVSASTSAPDFSHISRQTKIAITADDSSIEIKYQSRDGSSLGQWDNRWLNALRYDNG